MWLNPFVRRADSHSLLVSMTGVKLGDRVAFVGCANGARLAAIALKVGLSGRAVVMAPDEASATRAVQGAGKAGVLIDADTASLTRLPLDDAAFDLAVVDETANLLGAMTAGDRALAVREVARILRPGGRVVVVGTGAAAGLARLLAPAPPPSFATSGDANRTLEANGFGVVRTLAEREGLIFIEGIKLRV